MKSVKIALVVLLGVCVAVLTYLLGYHRGKRNDDRRHVALRLAKDVYLYQDTTNGLANVKSELAFFIFADYNFYERNYSNEPVAIFFGKKVELARKIAAQAATNGDVTVFTN